MKRSIQRAVAILFIVALAAGIVACNIISYNSVYHQKMQEWHEDAKAAAGITVMFLDNVGLDSLTVSETADEYVDMRRILRLICQDNSLEYLYIYTVDSNEIRHFIMTVASDDDDDELVRTKRGLGATSDEELDAQERAALNGEESDKPILLDNDFGQDLAWAMPYKNAEGDVVALIGADNGLIVSEEEIVAQFAITVIPLMAVMVLSFLAVFILLRRRVIIPIRMISARMNEFNPAEEPEPLQISSQDEMRQIADAFENMAGDIRTYIKDITAITIEQEQTKTQMNIARRIQNGMVPATFHETANNIDVAAMMQPAQEVGGDFYECFALPDGRYCAFIGDVSGKGVGGALFMALAMSLLRERLILSLNPAKALQQTNAKLCAKNPEGLFASVFVMVVEPKTGEMRYANGGHNPPVLLHANGADLMRIEPGEILGVFDDVDIRNETLTLAPGEGLLLYTDGVTEAIDENRTFYGTERLLALINSLESRSNSSETVDAIRDSVKSFSAGTVQFDDMTLVSAIYHGGNKAAR
jgi:sigma-B regulation protein RsbU (phosphoserine phosphatase)